MMKNLLTVLYITFLLFSCQKKDELFLELGCDCEGEPNKVLTNSLAIHNKSLIGILDPNNLQKGWIIHTATYCNPDFIKGKVNDVDTVYVSGNLRRPCAYGDWNYHSRLEVTEIRQK